MRPRPRAARSDPPQLQSITRIGIGYTFDELFGRAEVGYSFPLGQLVILENGFVLPVERLEPGMRMRLEDGQVATIIKIDEPKVWEPPSRTPTADGRYARRVVGTIKRTGFAVFDLMAGGQVITTTLGHPFWSVERQAWVAAGELRTGERLRPGDGSTVRIDGKSPLRRELIELYNMEVEEFHTCFVGGGSRGGVLVHNGLGGDCGIPKPTTPGQGPSQVNPADLISSHKLNKSPREMAALKESIRSKGFLDNADQPVSYVTINGQKHLVDGHHRVRAVRELGLGEIPAREVQLPYKGYRTEADLIDWER